MKGKCIIICAPSGAGKTSITKFLLTQNLGLSFSISACNRKNRKNEIDGVDYYFLSTEDFKKKIEDNEFIEWEEVYQNQFYGTLKTEVKRVWESNKHVIFDVDVIGGLNLARYFGEKAMAIFIQPPSIETLEERLLKRGSETEETIQKRIGKAMQELNYAKWFNYIIINDDLHKAELEALKLVKYFLKD